MDKPNGATLQATAEHSWLLPDLCACNAFKVSGWLGPCRLLSLHMDVTCMIASWSWLRVLHAPRY